jgi:tetratricopeptide (TPR) repeat protein
MLNFSQSALAVAEAGVRHADDPDLSIAYGYRLQEAGRHREAVDAYQSLLARHPQSQAAAAALANMANALKALGDVPQAELTYRKAMAADPHGVVYLLNYVRFLLDQKRWPEALALADRGLALCAESPDATQPAIRLHEDRAIALCELGRGPDALRSADAALALGSETIRSHYLRGRALALLGRLDECRDEMEWVLSKDSQNADALRAMRMLDAATRPGTGRAP